MRDISLVINSCTLANVKECVASILKHTDFGVVNAEFIIAANGMEPEGREWLDGLGSHFPYLWYDEKIGICRTTNDAVRMAKSNIVGRMDDDVTLLPWGGGSAWLQSLIYPFQNPEVGIVAPVVQQYNTDAISGYDAMAGFLFATRKKLWDLIGGFDESFEPGMGEDSDYSFKAQNLGYTLVLPSNTTATEYLPFELGMIFQGSYPIHHKSHMSCEREIVLPDGTITTVTQRNIALLNNRWRNKFGELKK